MKKWMIRYDGYYSIIDEDNNVLLENFGLSVAELQEIIDDHNRRVQEWKETNPIPRLSR